MKFKHICFIVGGYPTADDPVFTFVRQLIVSIADMGIKCSVIAPQNLTNSLLRGRKVRSSHWVDITKSKSKIDIYQPKFFSMSNVRVNNTSLTYFFWKQCVINTFSRLDIKPDALYGHFWYSGIVASIIANTAKLPVFVASGESKINVRNVFKDKLVNRYLSNINGVICVSRKNQLESIDLNLTTQEKSVVIPNAIDNSKFYLKNKMKVRRRLGFNENNFIVAFTGAFNSRKGVLRLSEAVNKTEQVNSIYIGSGELKPRGDNILFCGRVPHDQVVNYLNAADVFVLPTTAEGCSNAIIEAMACGLPIISSDMSFNADILDERNSILIDPNNTELIVNAINFMKNNPLKRKEMSRVSYEKALDLNIDNRSKSIINFMKKQV